MNVKVEACQQKQHFLAFLVQVDSTTRNEIKSFRWENCNEVQKIRIELLEEIKSVVLHKH